SNLTDNVVKTSKIGDKEVTARKTDFVKISSNLLNREDVVLNKIVSTTGEVTDNTGYCYSHDINVLPGQTLYATYIITLVFYNQNGEFIKRESVEPVANGFVVVPDNAYYVRANISRNFYDFPHVYDLMVAVSDVEIPYEPFHQKLDDIKVG